MTQPTHQIRAAAYIRVSTERQASEGLSLPEQERRVRAYAQAQGWQLVEVYADRGVSGRRDDRPALQRVLGGVAEIDRLIIPKLDRLGRSNRHLLDVFDQLEAADVQLVSVSEAIDTSTPIGKLLRSVLSAMAEFEADNISERVKAVTERRAREGGHHGGPRPYGYRFEGGSLVVDDAEAAVVRRIFREFNAGRSRREIARGLNRDGIPTAKGREWNQTGVGNVVESPRYKGEVSFKGDSFPGHHEAIVAPEIWDRAAQLTTATKRAPGAVDQRGAHTSSRVGCCAACTARVSPRCSRGAT